MPIARLVLILPPQFHNCFLYGALSACASYFSSVLLVQGSCPHGGCTSKLNYGHTVWQKMLTFLLEQSNNTSALFCSASTLRHLYWLLGIKNE